MLFLSYLSAYNSSSICCIRRQMSRNSPSFNLKLCSAMSSCSFKMLMFLWPLSSSSRRNWMSFWLSWMDGWTSITDILRYFSDFSDLCLSNYLLISSLSLISLMFYSWSCSIFFLASISYSLPSGLYLSNFYKSFRDFKCYSSFLFFISNNSCICFSSYSFCWVSCLIDLPYSSFSDLIYWLFRSPWA